MYLSCYINQIRYLFEFYLFGITKNGQNLLNLSYQIEFSIIEILVIIRENNVIHVKRM